LNSAFAKNTPVEPQKNAGRDYDNWSFSLVPPQTKKPASKQNFQKVPIDCVKLNHCALKRTERKETEFSARRRFPVLPSETVRLSLLFFQGGA
jgi:hypothetical protein